ncbi:MAG: hypothetical protein WBZ37_01585 [Mycobacterium sp.]
MPAGPSSMMPFAASKFRAAHPAIASIWAVVGGFCPQPPGTIIGLAVVLVVDGGAVVLVVDGGAVDALVLDVVDVVVLGLPQAEHTQITDTPSQVGTNARIGH